MRAQIGKISKDVLASFFPNDFNRTLTLVNIGETC